MNVCLAIHGVFYTFTMQLLASPVRVLSCQVTLCSAAYYN
ncbi:hypothetical protein PPAR_b0006 [Pseudoalteromonas paragorgicola KMM 3548]|nr:hypothetical protein [Pseudoalteromonas distincta KMM 3548]